METRYNPMRKLKMTTMETLGKLKSTYNGGTTSRYKWSQSVYDLSVQVDLPRQTRGKEVT